MRIGLTLPNLGLGPDPRAVVDLFVEAEQAGWDGVFVWDAPFVEYDHEQIQEAHDAWQVLALAAAATSSIRIGTMITPLPWRRPWLVARQAVTIDRLSGGRFVLGVGLGAPPGGGATFGEEVDRRERAAMLDEGLEILRRCWSGEWFDFAGSHYALARVRCLPRPVDGQVPVWVVGAWNRETDRWPEKRSLRRAAASDGILPNVIDGTVGVAATFDDITAMTAWLAAEGLSRADVVMEAGDPGDANTDPDDVRAWADAGATWWLEPVWQSMYRHPGDPTVLRDRIRSGPPRPTTG